jgi:hypothetical protein
MILYDAKAKTAYFIQAIDANEHVYLVVIYNKVSKSIQNDKAVAAYFGKFVELLRLQHLVGRFKST